MERSSDWSVAVQHESRKRWIRKIHTFALNDFTACNKFCISSPNTVKLDQTVWAENTEVADYKMQLNECKWHSRILQYNCTTKCQLSSPCYRHSSYKLSSITRVAGTSTRRREERTGGQTCGLNREGEGALHHTQFFHLSAWQALYKLLHVRVHTASDCAPDLCHIVPPAQCLCALAVGQYSNRRIGGCEWNVPTSVRYGKP
jgi:hypothetical protein